VRDERGRVYRVAGLTADVTHQKQAEEVLREREARLRLVVEQVPAILWTTDAQLRVTSRQGAGVAPLGEQPEEVNGKSLFDIHHTSDPTRTPLAQHLRALRGESATYEVERKGRTFQAHVEPFRAADGTITGVIGVALDITERKRAEEALRTAEKRLREAQQVAQLGSWEWDILKDEVVWSDQLYRTYGVNPQEFGATYQSFLACIHPEDREFTTRLVEKALRDHQPRTWHCRIVRPDGTVRVIQSRLEVVVDAAGRPGPGADDRGGRRPRLR
jgi:PAS domain S-box-containing protein